MTATEKRSTAKQPETSLQGVLFLTAGYGTRAEPLSFARPKCLLPWKNRTLLGNLIRQFEVLEPEIMAFNASRCPELILEEVSRYWKGDTRLIFEERPLGACGTLAANSDLLRGTWAVCNTDFVMEVPAAAMVSQHASDGGGWTVLTCDLPACGGYSSLVIEGRERHYAGVSIISAEVARTASSLQISEGFFTTLRKACLDKGIPIREYYHRDKWLDMGETELFRRNTLLEGSFVHPSARVSQGALLEGFYSLGPYCIINRGASVRNSVLLEGAEILKGQKALDTVLPWYAKGVHVD